MRSNYLNSTMKRASLAFAVLLLAAGVALGQSVNLAAGPTTTALPDGQVVQMWGYSCVSASNASCAALNTHASPGSWSPIVITVAPGPLTINLTNNLSFATGSGTNYVPTSLVIVGQLGGGLGAAPTRTPSPDHSNLASNTETWPIVGTPGDFQPPTQPDRVQSFAQEVAATGASLGNGQCASGCALTWNNLKPGTYLIESGTHPSIQGPMGLYGMLVVTTAPANGNPGTAYPGVNYNAEVPLLLSEIDPVQNNAVAQAVMTPNFSETAVWSGKPGACGDPAVHTCYPPAVNYDPRYYLMNGIAFDRTNSTASLFAASPASNVTGSVLVRFVNAGLRMHIPSIVRAETVGLLPSGTPGTVPGFSLIAEDGNLLPEVALAAANNKPLGARIQSEVFLAAGKTYDVLINAVNTQGNQDALPVFDRQLSLSTNNQRDGGMQGYIGVNGSLPTAAGLVAQANPDSYFVVAGNTLTVSDPAKGLLANDVGIYGVQISGPLPNGLNLNSDGTFTYTGPPTSFNYCGNGQTSGSYCTTVSLNACTGACLGSAPTANPDVYTSKVATKIQVSPPGVLANDVDPQGHPLKAVFDSVSSNNSCAAKLNSDGSFTATASGPGTCTITYHDTNSQNTSSATTTATITFPTPSNLQLAVKDAKNGKPVNDYRWIIEEDRTFQIDPKCQQNTNPRPANCPALPVPSIATNFHTSYMPVVAQGCIGTVSCESGQTQLGQSVVCDVGNGDCEPGTQKAPLNPSQVYLDPTKRYYISVLPGDGADPFNAGYAGGSCANGATAGTDPDGTPIVCGHTMGGASIAPGQTNVTVLVEPTPLPTGQIAVFVFEDDNPLNGENDAGGGVDVLAPNEPGLGGFEITLFDQAGNLGDSTGQPTYDMFNMPLTNALSGTIDPATGQNACPISPTSTDGMVGMIVTCPTYEADGKTLSPLAGQAVIPNLYPGLYEVFATPGADRIARGEEWLQTNTLDGTKPHEAFVKPGEPAYFQEFGPAGFHVTIGFANPAVINARLSEMCGNGVHCNNTVNGQVTETRLSRIPDERLYSSGSYDADSFTQCYASIGDPDGEDFSFAKCDENGQFSFSGIPDGQWRITVFDQWNDILVDGLSVPIGLSGGANGATASIEIPMQQWRTNVYTRTYIDQNGNGIPDRDSAGNDLEPGLPLVPVNVRFRDGSYSNFNSTDLNGYAGFNEIFPFFHWLVLEADTTRYKQTGVHVVYDAGGPADGSPACSANSPCGNSSIAAGLANTYEAIHLPTSPVDVRFPGSVYCADADCLGAKSHTLANPSTGRIDPPWVTSEAWQGFIGNAEFVEFGKKLFAPGETGGIKGHVIYASTRPFDDPSLLLQLSWEPGVPNVLVNLYQETKAADGTQSLKLVDHTTTTSWDAWAQGFRSNGVPNMNCPGQDPASPFYFTLQNSKQWLNPNTPLPYNSQFKCYDGMPVFNQVQPAPYDGMYQFPSVTAYDPVTGKPSGTNCSICQPNHATDPADWYYNTPMLPPGKYVVEVVVPDGYELVKEEDKNILIGDNYIAPVTQQFGGLGNIFIMPDQAEVAAAYNGYNSQNPTNSLGAQPRHEGDTGSVETFWPCVGKARIVPDYISLFPQSAEVAPFAGATRNLCDRKEVTLTEQSSALAKFYIFTSTHIAAHYTGIITDDFSSEFDPFSPAFGEKFSPPNLPISLKDFNGTEITRTYADQWGFFNGLTYSTWEVNPPNPTGYGPTMMVTCMNDPGPIPDPAHPGQMMTDPMYNPNYSQFCYEIPFMPGQTFHMDTPVVPTAAFAEGYNPPDCAYPEATPAIKSVLGDVSHGGQGPWISAAGHSLTINALGDVNNVPNYAYSGPQATAPPFNQKFITRHYGFGSQRGTVTVGGQSVPNASISAWSDSQIVLSLPSTLVNNLPICATSYSAALSSSQAAAKYGRCGELVITAANGQRSIDTVTITVGGTAPAYVNGENAANNALQTALNNANPGDLVIVGPGVYREMLLMWKPVRLQGVGAASVTIDANPHPAGKLDPWRAQVNCLFGLLPNGRPALSSYPGCTIPTVANNPMQVDRVELEGILGWDTTTNGNLAELLQEPTLMGAYEGAGITVLGKGVRFPAGSDPFGGGAEAAFPAGTVRLTNSSRDCSQFPSNFLCNPSRIDGISFTDSSQGGGAILVHGWNHNLEIANNRIYSNAGTLSGGINVGQGEFPDAVLNLLNVQQGYGINVGVNVHHNMVTHNASIGDELYSATPAGAGGVTFCTGSDNYAFNFNWVCGNLSTGDGGGVVHSGFSLNGSISNNTIIFNQSNNPTIPTNGGGIAVQGAAPDRTLPDGTECGSITDVDCVPGLSEGTGRGLVIDANLIVGNTAESGSGGGIMLQQTNGQDVTNTPLLPLFWNSVTLTNNIIANNVAGWDGGGVSLQDSLKVAFVNNTVVSNDTTASAGVLFNTIGAPLSSGTPPACDVSTGSGCTTTSTNQAAGLVTMQHTSNLTSALTGITVVCPGPSILTGGFPYSTAINGNCKQVSLPLLYNDLFWQNRAFHITVGSFGPGTLSQQHLVTLVPTLNQTFEGQCVSGASYWDLGVRGDTGPTNHASGFTLNANYSLLTSGGSSVTGTGNISPGAPGLYSQYCNGSRVPPENGGMGYDVPPGIADAQVPNPVFNLTPAATVDEGNNWINMSYGPLDLTSLTGAMLGNYAITPNSPAVNAGCPLLNVTCAVYRPNHDIFGNSRPLRGGYDIGATESAAPPAGAVLSVTPTSLAFSNVVAGTTSSAQVLTLTNTGGSTANLTSLVFSSPLFSRITTGAFPAGAPNCGNSLAANSSCSIKVVFSPTAVGSVTGTLTINASVAVSGSPVLLQGTGI
jgi:hypothetical protein